MPAQYHSSPFPVKSSPIKRKAQGSVAFSSKLVSAETKKKEIAREMRGSFVGPMPVAEFLDEFLPKVEELPDELKVKDHFKTMPVHALYEKCMYDPFIKLVHADAETNRPSMIPNFKVVNTSDNTDPNSDENGKVKPDLSIYPANVDVSAGVTQLDKTMMDLELKPRASLDPFVGREGFGRNCGRSNSDTPLEAEALRRIKCRGQIISYATEVHRRQHRCHSFSLVITGQYARFLRWDRAGVIVSERFDFINDAIPLIEYLWRFAHLPNAGRGLDCTVTEATPQEVEIAEKFLGRWKPKFVDRPILHMEVPDGEGTRPCLIWGAFSEANSPIGRATRGYPAVDLRAKKVVFIKDTWRPDSDLVDKESQTLKILNDAKVSHVPKFICGDDIPNQRTRTQDFINKSWSNVQDLDKDQFISRVHHRFIEDVVGHPLYDFKSSKEFMQAIFDAFIAHQEAVEKCGILHRDISVGNILITDEGCGLLNDWDLARSLDAIAKGPRLPQRTGTWQFMSVRLLSKPDKIHEIQDDLESFVYVVLYCGLRYMKHNRMDGLDSTMEAIFDDMCVMSNKSDPLGGLGKRGMITGGDLIDYDFRLECEPITAWVFSALDFLSEWLIKTDPGRRPLGYDVLSRPDVKVDRSQLFLHNHTAMRKLFSMTMKRGDWPIDDSAVDFLPKASANRKRSRYNDEDGSSRSSKKRRSSIIQGSAPS